MSLPCQTPPSPRLLGFMIPVYPCVSLLYTPCPVQPPLALSLYPASHSHPALCVYSASSSATQPNKATLVRSLAPTGQTLPRFTTLKRMGQKNMQRTFTSDRTLLPLYKAVNVWSVLSDLRNYTMNTENH